MPRNGAEQMHEGTITLSARVPLSLARTFARFSSEADRTVSAEVRRAMRLYIATMDNESPAGKPGFVQTAAAGAGAHEAAYSAT